MSPRSLMVPTKPCRLNTVHRIEEPGFTTRTATHAEIHNIVGLENARATYEGLLKLRPNERPFVLTRATYAGGQRYGFTWTGDNSATWNHLRLATQMVSESRHQRHSFRGRRRGRIQWLATSRAAHALGGAGGVLAILPRPRHQGQPSARGVEQRTRAGSHPAPLHRNALSPAAVLLRTGGRSLAHGAPA